MRLFLWGFTLFAFACAAEWYGAFWSQSETTHTQLPVCQGCYLSFSDKDYQCCDGMTLADGQCLCSDEKRCAECQHSSKQAVAMDMCSGTAVICNDTSYTCCAKLEISQVSDGLCFCDGQRCNGCTESFKNRENRFLIKDHIHYICPPHGGPVTFLGHGRCYCGDGTDCGLTTLSNKVN